MYLDLFRDNITFGEVIPECAIRIKLACLTGFLVRRNEYMSIINSAPLSPSRFSAIRRRIWGQMFGRLIQGVRQTAGCSIEETALLAGMEVSEWEAIEAGYVPTDTGRLRSMAGALEMGWTG